MNQLSFPAGVMRQARRKGDKGIDQTVAATERRNDGWVELACSRLRDFARGQVGMFTVELARLSFESKLPPPHDKRVWGAVTRMAVTRGFIECVKGQYFPAASSNSSPKPVYRRGPLA